MVKTRLGADTNLVGIQDDRGATATLYKSKWLLGEQAQYHFTCIVADIVWEDAPDLSSLLLEAICRYVNPVRPLERRSWAARRSARTKQTRRLTQGAPKAATAMKRPKSVWWLLGDGSTLDHPLRDASSNFTYHAGGVKG